VFFKWLLRIINIPYLYDKTLVDYNKEGSTLPPGYGKKHTK
jgi:hypothetical protein